MLSGIEIIDSRIFPRIKKKTHEKVQDSCCFAQECKSEILILLGVLNEIQLVLVAFRVAHQEMIK